MTIFRRVKGSELFGLDLVSVNCVVDRPDLTTVRLDQLINSDYSSDPCMVISDVNARRSDLASLSA